MQVPVRENKRDGVVRGGLSEMEPSKMRPGG